MKRWISQTLLLVTFIGVSYSSLPAQSLPSLPDPLTLEQALALAEVSLSPDLELLEAERELAEADALELQSLFDPTLYFTSRARWVIPGPRTRNPSKQDHSVGLYASKRLYDFGRTAAALNAAQMEIKANKWLFINARRQRRLKVMKLFFDVLLADLAYARDNEAMAIAYVRLTRVRDRHELGQVSDLVLFEHESRYQEARRQRYASEALQRITRSRLALALNRPGQLPSNLVEPQLVANHRALPDLDSLVAKALQFNPYILALKEKIRAAEERVRSARLRVRPVVYLEAEATYFKRSLGFRDRARAGVRVEFPLYGGRTFDALVAKREAEVQRLKAELEEKKLELQQALLETWLKLNTLYIQQQEMESLEEYRDLYLDRSRALYELEVRANLGNAMVEYSVARYRIAETEYNIVLAWEELQALTGEPLEDE